MKRALSAAERVVVASCFLVMLIGLYAVYVMGSRYLRMTQLQSQLQSQASLALQGIVHDLSLTIDDPQAIRSAPGNLRFLSSESTLEGDADHFVYDQAGHLQWCKWVGFVIEAQQLWRSEVPAEGAQRRPFENLIQPTAENFFHAPHRVIAESIEGFDVERRGAGLYSVKVVAALPGLDGQISKTQLDTEVYLLNGCVP